MKLLLAVFCVVVSVWAEFQSANTITHHYLSDPRTIPQRFRTDDDEPYGLEIKGDKVGIVAGPHKIIVDIDTLFFKDVEDASTDNSENECHNTKAYANLCGEKGKCIPGGRDKTSDESQYCGITMVRDKFPVKNEYNKTLPVMMFSSEYHQREVLPLLCGSAFENMAKNFEEVIEIKSVVDGNLIETVYALFVNKTRRARESFYGLCSYSGIEIDRKLNEEKAPIKAFNKKSGKWESFMKANITDDHPLMFYENAQRSQTVYAMINFNLPYSANITHYEVMSYQGLDNVQYAIHYFATADRKIYKSITDGQYVNVTIELFNGIIGKITDMKIFGSNLIVLTDSVIYSLPLAICDTMWKCSKCVELRDPMCLWDEKSCVVANEEHKSIKTVQRVKDGKTEFCVGEYEGQQQQLLIETLNNQLNRTKEEIAKLEEFSKGQKNGFSGVNEELKDMKETVKTIQDKLKDMNSTMVETNDNVKYSYKDWIFTGFFAAVFCALFVVLKRFVVYTKVRYVDKNPNAGFLDTIVTGNSQYDRFTSPTNGD